MSEEYIYPSGISSLDVECCDCCLAPFLYEELEEYMGEKICHRCLDMEMGDRLRDQMKDDRLTGDY